MVWIALLILLATALALLWRPLAVRAAPLSLRAPELAVYESQLAEVDADLARDLISATEAEAARNEIRRKMLSVKPVRAGVADPARAAAAARYALMIGLPLVSAALYLTLGRPDLPGRTFVAAAPAPSSTASATATTQLDDVETMVARLAARLEKAPDDVQGWRMLGWAYAHIDRPADAVKAFARAVALNGDDAGLLSQYGEAVVAAAGGVVTTEAERLFDRALTRDGKEPRALFFRGLALEQRGKPKEALALWTSLMREADPNAPWLSDVRQRANELAIKLKFDPARILPSAPAPAPTQSARGPKPEDMAAAAELSPDQRTEMISGMVNGLEQRLQRDPNDLDGWLMLARSKSVLGERDAAREAIRNAQEHFKNDNRARERIAQIVSELRLN